MPTFVRLEHHQVTYKYSFEFETDDAELWKQLVEESGDESLDKDKPPKDAVDWYEVLEMCNSVFDGAEHEVTAHSGNKGGYEQEFQLEDD